MTYEGLNQAANRLARRLVREAPHEGLVGLLIPRSASLIVAQLAVLKAGRAYVPIDPALPPARVAWLREQTAITIAPTTAGVTSHVLAIDDPTLESESGHDLEQAVGPDDLAHVLFTSGSTGTPRGVCIPHRGVVRLVHGTYTAFGPDEVFLQLAPASFDASTFEFWAPLLHGARLVIAPTGPLSIGEIVALVERHAITTLWLTTGLFDLFVDHGVSRLASLRQVLTGGDVISPAHAARFLEQLPTCRLIHAYGPTENTTFTTTYEVRHAVGHRGLPIGRPIANTDLYVLDERQRPVPIGVVGEAYVGGDGLALGYWEDEPATRERFLVSPFARGERLYRTGDLLRWRPDGELEFVGRCDDQVKINGVRVEPAEVELAIGTCPGVAAAAVVARASADGRKTLAAHIVPRTDSENLAAVVRDHLRARLPSSLVPTQILVVERLPLLPSGKVD